MNALVLTVSVTSGVTRDKHGAHGGEEGLQEPPALKRFAAEAAFCLEGHCR